MATLFPDASAKFEDAMREITSFFIPDFVANTFCGYVHISQEEQKEHRERQQQIARNFFSRVTEDQRALAAALKQFSDGLYEQSNPMQCAALAAVLEYLVQQCVVPSKPVCEALLGIEKLDYRHSENWCIVFGLVRRIVGGVDYKGCRDLLRVILEKCYALPAIESSSMRRQLDAICDVARYIIDRNACLLPSYFAINEIMKFQHEDKPPPHWALGQDLARFIQSFRGAAQIVTVTGPSSLLPVIGHSNINVYAWRLDIRTLRFPMSGPLPYDKDKVQTGLVRYVLSHSYAVDFVTSILCLNKQNKQRCLELEEQLADNIFRILELHEEEAANGIPTCDSIQGQQRWNNMSAQTIFFVLFQLVSFQHVVALLCKKLEGKVLRKSCLRDHLAWMLLQFLFGLNLSKASTVPEFVQFFRLFDLLYTDKELLPVPDCTRPHSAVSMAVTCLWIHLMNKAKAENTKLVRPLPAMLRGHVDFLKDILSNPMGLHLLNDYRLVLLCNACSSNDLEMNNVVLPALNESLIVESQTTFLPNGVKCHQPTTAIPVHVLDVLTVQAKMMMLNQIFQRLVKQTGGPTALGPPPGAPQANPATAAALASGSLASVALSPALIETCARLLVYVEMELVGIKSFFATVIPRVFSSKSAPTIYALLEMASYRLSHVQPHYRMTVLSALLSNASAVSHNQLYHRIESTALRLILSLGNTEVQQQVYRSVSESKFTLVSSECEELNRVLVLTLARAVHVTNSEGVSSGWCKGLLKKVSETTPHGWSSHTAACFPAPIQEYFAAAATAGTGSAGGQGSLGASSLSMGALSSSNADDRQALKKSVEGDYMRWHGMPESEKLQHFTAKGGQQPTPQFLCVLWKSIANGDGIGITAYKILEALGPRALTSQLRTLCDYFHIEVQSCQDKVQFVKYTEAINTMIWKYNIFTLDRFVLFSCFRPFESHQAQVCLYAIQTILTKERVVNMINDFVKENSANFWYMPNWYDKHMMFHQKYPEKYFYEGMIESCGGSVGTVSLGYLPCYYDNMCLRLLTVLEVILHRLIEALPFGQTTEKSLLQVVSSVCKLFKYHDRPITYLYTTLHYYSKILEEKPEMKRRLVQAIVFSLEEKVPHWHVSPAFGAHLQQPPPPQLTVPWSPPDDYYSDRVGALVSVITPNCSNRRFVSVDWRFCEFTNAPALVLSSTCVELMAAPLRSHVVASALLDVIYIGRFQRSEVLSWMNAVALLVTALPDPYWQAMNDRVLLEFQKSDYLVSPHLYDADPFEVFNFSKCAAALKEYKCTTTLALCHAVWHHASIGQLSSIPQFVKEKVKPVVRTEEQFLYLCHLIGPFLQRFHHERTRCCIDLTVELYDILDKVDKSCQHMRYIDTITDFFYHIKYMFVGDEVKTDVEKVIRGLRTSLQLRLRFIAHHARGEEPLSAASTPAAATPAAP